MNLSILGQTGSGKTSISNALFDLNWAIDGAVACTQRVHSHKGAFSYRFMNTHQITWHLNDTPGIGESEDADVSHYSDVLSAFQKADVILWVVQADTRAFAEDQESIILLTNGGNQIPNAHFVIALNHVDKVHPVNWNEELNCPSDQQVEIICQKIELVFERFSTYLPIKKNNIVPCSAAKKYGLTELVNTLVIGVVDKLRTHPRRMKLDF